MRFENLLTRSARIAWRHPWLWLLALLAGEASGGSGGGGGGGSGFSSRSGAGQPAPPDLSWVPAWIGDRAGYLFEIAVVLLLVWLLLFVLSCVASGALVGAAGRIDSGERIGFAAAWRLGLETFWRVLAFRLLQVALALAGLLPLLLPPLLGAAGWGLTGLLKGLLLDLPLLVAAIFWLVFLGWLSLLALRSLLLDRAGPMAAYRLAWSLFKRRFPRIALTGVVFGLVGFGIGIALQLAIGLVTAPFVGPVADEFVNGRWSELVNTVAIALAVLVPVSLLLSSAVGAYFSTAWTVAYRRLDHDGEVPEPVPLPA